MKRTSLYSFLSDNSYLVPIGIACITIVLLYLTLAPSNMLGHSKLWNYDKLGHLLMFGSWTFFIGLYNYINAKPVTNLWVIFIAGVIFGALVEFLQYVMPFHRDPDVYDLLFDAIGCFLAILLLKVTIPKSTPTAQNS
ncbi:MAG TPA: VanZ family protein [Balneolaceae bacterium]|nr:VanZ family protein [Balneolaceae bacterium]